MSVARKRFHILSILIGLGLLSVSASAQAHRHRHYRNAAHRAYAHLLVSSAAPVIQCVAFAKQDAGIDIPGNARDWWSNAAGIYERGTRPETGSVLSFQQNERMPLGHVAVVSGIANSRTIIIDQSHWNSRGITRGVTVIDVSDDNDWSSVRVQLGHGAEFGSIYPTHGFIYARPDPQAVLPDERERAPAVRVALGRARRKHHATTEIAEAPQASQPLDLRISGLR